MNFEHNISQEELEQIERFLQNKMSEDEATAFATRMQTDENFRQKVEIIKLTTVGINETILSERLNDYHKNLDKATSEGQFSRKWLWAASFIFMVAISMWWLMQSTNKNQRIYTRYYKPDPGLMTVMSSDEENYTFEKAMVEYKSGAYDKALVAWTQLLRKKPYNDTLLYFSGAAYQATSDYDSAVRYLMAVANDTNSSFQKDASWYLGLIYLQKGENEKAIKYLQVSQHEKSQQIIKAITP